MEVIPNAYSITDIKNTYKMKEKKPKPKMFSVFI